MYVRKILIEQVINLFISQPDYRDSRYGTIEYICNQYYKEYYGLNIKSDYKMLSDIDRCFRLVQQEIPKLRGKNWIKRQKQAGEIPKDKYDIEISENINNVCKQLKIFE
jgi:hypothetical protein